MFPWSSTFTSEPQLPIQRSSEEMVTNMLMLELASLLKRTERLRQERVAQSRRRSSSVDYSWLVESHQKPSYELTPGQRLELQDLCAKIPPSKCGPIILKVRNLVMELEPEVTEVSRLFRLVLCDCLDEQLEGVTERDRSLHIRASLWSRQRSKSAFSIGQSSRQRLKELWSGQAMGQVRKALPEEEEAYAGDEEKGVLALHSRRARSMPDISSVEEKAHTLSVVDQ